MIFLFCLLAGIALSQASVLPARPESKLSDTKLVFHKSVGETPEDQYIIQELLAYQELHSRNIIEDNIQDLLESFRDVVINGNDNLPPLDPLEVDQVGPFNFRTLGFSASLNLRNIYLEGLRWYTIDDVSLNALRLSFGLKATIPRLTFRGSFDTRVKVAYVITHRAGGDISVFINRFEYGLDMRLGTNLFAGHLFLREFNMKLGFGDLIITVDGLTGSNLVNSVISNVVNNVSHGAVMENIDSINEAVSEALFEVINDVLKEYTLADLLG